jgi:hypothetical protein
LEAAAAAAMAAGLDVMGTGAARGVAGDVTGDSVLTITAGAVGADGVAAPKGMDMPGCAPEAKARLKAATSSLSKGSGDGLLAVLGVDANGLDNGVVDATGAEVLGRAIGSGSAWVTSNGLAGRALVCGGKLNNGAGALTALPEDRAWGDRPNSGAGALAVPPAWPRVTLLLTTVS